MEIEGRLPEAIEMAAYYLIAESLANIGKYAQASSATVELARQYYPVCIEFPLFLAAAISHVLDSMSLAELTSEDVPDLLTIKS